MAFERNGKHEKLTSSADGAVLVCRNLGVRAEFLLDFLRGMLSAPSFAGSNDYRLSRLRPAKGQPEALCSGAADDTDRPVFSQAGSVMRTPLAAPFRRRVLPAAASV